jgi:hypothetical protein
MRLLVVDQFSGLSPYWLSQNPSKFDELAAEMIGQNTPQTWRPAKVIEVEDVKTHRAEHCTTVFYEDENGMAKHLCHNWDSSG